MRPNFDYGDPLLKNEAKFQDPFFRRFHLREAPVPFQLDEKISKSYLFPIFYADVTCAMGIFMCDYDKAQAILPHPRMKPESQRRPRLHRTGTAVVGDFSASARQATPSPSRLPPSPSDEVRA